MQRRNPRVPFPGRPAEAAPRKETPDAFEEFQASVLFCSRCRAPRPVRERLLLVLPDGDLYEYVCTACGDAVGSRKGDPGAEFGGRGRGLG